MMMMIIIVKNNNNNNTMIIITNVCLCDLTSVFLTVLCTFTELSLAYDAPSYNTTAS